ncbi:MAG: hypothetical protein K8F91_16680, partial [Candidatus Obscuribacterales bacterium]|nr:hypothetical protein [Candidatus Obscuribacterales bacterium]
THDTPLVITDGDETLVSSRKARTIPNSGSEAYLKAQPGPLAEALYGTRKEIDKMPDGPNKKAALKAARESQKEFFPGSYEHTAHDHDAGTFQIPQNTVETHSDGSVMLKINVSETVINSEETTEGWLEAGRRISELPLDKQLEVIGSGLKAGYDQYQHDEQEHAWGRLIGTVQGAGEVAVNLAKVADYSAALILGDKEKAGQAGAEFGEALGKTIVGGVRLFQAAQNYSYEVGYTGDYATPFRDIATIGQALDQQWSRLPPREQERLKLQLATEVVGSVALPAGAMKLAKAERFTVMIEEAGLLARQIGTENKAVNAIEKLTKPLTDRLHMPEVPENLRHLELQKASPELIRNMEHKGRDILIAQPGTDEFRYLISEGLEGSAGNADLMHILLRSEVKKITALEEFLHGTQGKIGITKMVPREIVEYRVKDFMIRHSKLLGLDQNDLDVLSVLRETEAEKALLRGYSSDLFKVGRHE